MHASFYLCYTSITEALVVTENLSNYNGSLSGIEVNGTTIQIPRVLLEKTTGQESGMSQHRINI